jgi:lipoprotein NlpI
MRCFSLLTVLALLTALHMSAYSIGAESADELLKKAGAAFEKKQLEEALQFANQAVKADPKKAQAYFVRGFIYSSLQRHAEALADCDKAIALDPKNPGTYDLRGSEHFKLGRIAESIADFDKYLEFRPADTPGHWRRGISYYYAGRFEEGAKQFESGHAKNSDDVEEAVWHYLCNARATGVEKARAALLKIGNDRRVPMMQVYALYAGRAKPEDVLAAAVAGKPSPEQLNHQLFYAHLYLGLYYEAAGDKNRALENLTKAAEEHKVGDYMWDVAHVHVNLLRKGQKPK